MTGIDQRRGLHRIAILFTVCFLFSLFACFPARDVYAANSVGVSINVYSDTDGQILGNTSGFDSGVYASAGFTINLSKPVHVEYTWGVSLTGGNDTASLRVSINDTGSGDFNTGDWGINIKNVPGDTLSGLTFLSVDTYTCTPTPAPAATDTPTPVPATATPKPATATPTPVPATATPTPKPATATPTPKPATATPTPKPATATPAAAATDTPTPVPATATPVPNTDPVAPVVQPDPGQPTATPTPTNTPTPTPELRETPTPGPDGRESAIAPVIHESEPDVTDETEPEETDPGDTPTPTTVKVVASTSSDKDGGFPWWIVAVALLLLIGGRYGYLRKIRALSRKDAAIDLIPGVRKLTGAKYSSSAPAVAATTAPNVVNGYLQTSNTKSIRPVYSNTPAARAAEAQAMGQGAAPAPAPGLKAPIKRPASASVNHAQVAAAAKTAPVPQAAPAPAPAPAPALKAPVKRPASASVNHAQVAATAAVTTQEAAKQDAKKRAASAAEEASKALEAAAAARKAAEEASKALEAAEAAFAAAKARTASSINASVSETAKATGSRPAPEQPEKLDSSSTSHTAAQEAFLKQQSEQKLAPAIATGIVPPVIEEKVDNRPSPFKPLPKEPVKRNQGSGNKNVEAVKDTPAPAAAPQAEDHVPPIAQFSPIPLKKEEESPFKPISHEEASPAPGLKPPIKRPASASINRAAALQAEKEKDQSAI